MADAPSAASIMVDANFGRGVESSNSMVTYDPNNLFATSTVRGLCDMMGYNDEDKDLVENRLFHDPKIMDLLKEHKLNDIINQLHRLKAKPKYFCKYVTSAEDINNLAKTFTMYNICYGADMQATNHPYARESRMLEHAYIYDFVLKYDNGVRISENHDYMVKDVGGHPVLHDNHNRSKVHVCMPILCAKDHFRYDNWKTYVQRNVNGSRIRSTAYPLVRDYISDNPRSVCHKKSQHCCIKAPVLTFIHSAYDMTLDDLAVTFDQADAEKAYIVMLYTPEIEIDPKGYIPNYECDWRIFDVAGVRYINFMFKTDAGLSYVHRLDHYLALIHQSWLRTPKGSVYVIDRELRNHTLYFNIVKVANNYISQELILKRMTFLDKDDVMFVAMYDYNMFSAGEKLVPIVIKTSKGFLDSGMLYALALGDTKFVVDVIRRYLVSANSQVTIGTVTHKGPGHSADELCLLSVFIYIYVYILNWKAGKITQAITSDEGKMRIASMSGWMRLAYQFWYRSNPRKHPMIVDGNSFKSRDEAFNYVETTLIKAEKDENYSRNGKSIFQWISELLPDLNRRYPLALCGPRSFTTIEAIQAELLTDRVSDYSYCHPVRGEDLINSDKVKRFTELEQLAASDPFLNTALKMVRARQESGYGRSTFLKTFRKNTVCDGRNFLVKNVPGDGNCFYHCLIAGLKLEATPDYLRKRLLKSKYFEMICSTIVGDRVVLDETIYADMTNRLSCVNTQSEDKWADDNVLLLSALELSIELCVHTPDARYSYNAPVSSSTSTKLSFGECVHIFCENHHFSLLKEDASSMVGQEDIILERSETLVDFEDFEFELLSPLMIEEDPIPKIAKIHRDYTKDKNSFARTKLFGYDSYYGPMLGVVLSNYEFARSQKILDIDPRNKSSLQYFCDNHIGPDYAEVTSIAVGTVGAGSYVPTYHEPKHRKTSWRHGTSPRFDRIVGDQKFDIVSINPAYYSDDIGIVNPIKHHEHIKRMMPATANLAVGGILIIAVQLPFDRETVSLATQLLPYFSETRIIEPLIKPSYVAWAFIVCKGKLKSEVVVIENASLDSKFPMTVVAQMSSMSEVHADRLNEEVVRIVAQTFKPLSDVFVEKLKEFVPLRKLYEISGGYLVGNIFPTFCSTICKQAPSLSKEFVRDHFSDIGDHYLAPENFDILRRKLSEKLHEYIVRKNDRAPLTKSILRTLISNPSIDEFDRKYYIAYYMALSKGNTFVELSCKPSDFGKPMSSRWFYANFLTNMFDMLQCDLKDAASGLPDSDEEPDNDFKFPRFPEGLLPPLRDLTPLQFSISAPEEITLETDDDDDDNQDSFVSVNTSGYYDQPEKLFWADGSYSKDYKAASSIYIEEYKSIIENSVNKLVSDIKSVVGKVCANALGTLRARDFALKPWIGEDYHKDCVISLEGEIVYGRLKAATDLKDRRYFMEFDIGADKIPKNFNLVAAFDSGRRSKKLPLSYISVTQLGVFMENDILESLQLPVFSNGVMPEVSIIQAGPGCGKTHTILKNLCDDLEQPALAVMKNHENVLAAVERMKRNLKDKKLPDNTSLKKIIMDKVVSIDTVLSKPGNFSDAKFTKVFIDEAMTHHPGKIAALCKLLGAPTLLYGDVMQIGYICRVAGYEPQYSNTSQAYPISGLLDVSYRCPKDICYMLSPGYAGMASVLGNVVSDDCAVLRSNSDVSVSIGPVKLIAGVHNIAIDSATQYLTFTQAEKDDLNNIYKTQLKDKPAATIHEYQGNENPKVAIVRTRLMEDVSLPGGIYASMPHIVSGVSRHTKSLTYFTVKLGDPLSQQLTRIRTDFPKWHAKNS